MNEFENLNLFMESNENIGILFNSYKERQVSIKNFLGLVEEKISILLKDPVSTNINIDNDIENFKLSMKDELVPEPININDISVLKKDIQKYRSEIDVILRKFSGLKKKISFGGNWYRFAINRPKVYLKDIDNDNHSQINDNIRRINRALDWIENSLISLYNLIDQDLNILNVVNIVYNKHHIYESASIDEFDLLNENIEESKEEVPEPPSIEDKPEEEPKKESLPKQTDKAESNKNGVRRKQLYIAFIEWCKEYNSKNTFGINKMEENIIGSHMFPVNIIIPCYLESWIVNLVDKIVASFEFTQKFSYGFSYATNLLLLFLINSGK